MKHLSAWAVFMLFFSLSLLAWSGETHTSDGLSMVAVSDSLVRYGRWDIESVRWLGLQQGTYGPDGLLYSRKGLATSILALPLVWLGFTIPGIGPIHTATLLTPILHALTAAYLYLIVRRLLPTVPPTRALLIPALWAFGSLAFAYIKTWFSEPAVTLATVAALFHLIRLRDRQAWREAVFIGAWLGFSLLTRSANAIVFPIFGLALLAVVYPRGEAGADYQPPLQWRSLLSRRILGMVTAFIVPIALSGLIYLWYNNLRFGDPFESGYIAGEDFSAIWRQGILGQTISLGRGLIWYTPWLVLTFIGARRWWGNERLVTVVCVACTVTYILFYGKWYLWSGGYAWGPRFLVPIVPLLALLVAPILQEGAWQRWRIPFISLGLLGFGINLIGVLWDFDLQIAALEATGRDPFSWDFFWTPAYAQIPHLLAIGSRFELGQDFDPVWSLNHRLNGWIAWPLFLTVVFGLLPLSHRHFNKVVPFIQIGFLLLTLQNLHQGRGINFHRLVIPPMQAGEQLWYDMPWASETVLNQVKTRNAITGFFVEGPSLSPEDEQRARQLTTPANAPIYLLSDGPDRLNHGLDRILAESHFLADDSTFMETDEREAIYWQGPLSDPIPYDLRLAFGDGAALRLTAAQLTPQVTLDGVFALALTWQTEGPLPPASQIFVQIKDANGEIMGQLDGPLMQGWVDSSTLSAGQTLVDRHAGRLGYLMPIDSGRYTVHAGLYRYDTLERAATADGQNEIVIPLEITAELLNPPPAASP